MDSKRFDEVLAPWDKLAMTRWHVAPWPLSSGEIVAIDVDKVPEVDLVGGDRDLVTKYQCLDFSKMDWLADKKREFVPCREVGALAGCKINLLTGEIVGPGGNHLHITTMGTKYQKVKGVLWHVATEFEYQHRRFLDRCQRVFDGANGQYKGEGEYQVHHRYETFRDTSFGNSLLSVSLVPTKYHVYLHGVLDGVAKKIERDGFYRDEVVVEMNPFTIRKFRDRLARDPQKAEAPKAG